MTYCEMDFKWYLYIKVEENFKNHLEIWQLQWKFILQSVENFCAISTEPIFFLTENILFYKSKKSIEFNIREEYTGRSFFYMRIYFIFPYDLDLLLISELKYCHKNRVKYLLFFSKVFHFYWMFIESKVSLKNKPTFQMSYSFGNLWINK